jgi:hypothetical protein
MDTRKLARNCMLSPVEFERRNKTATEGVLKTRAIHWFNHRRLLEQSAIPPAEAEACYYASLNQTAVAA